MHADDTLTRGRQINNIVRAECERTLSLQCEYCGVWCDFRSEIVDTIHSLAHPVAPPGTKKVDAKSQTLTKTLN
jgi:hypothetical protein